MTDLYAFTDKDIEHFVLSVLSAALISIVVWVVLNHEL